MRTRRKVSVANTISHAKGGQFVTHVKALPGNPYDGHTLATVIPEMEALAGNTIARMLTDKGYRGHKIKRELRRRSAVEPVIGHLKDDHRMRRNYLKGRDGDRINAVLAAAGYNFSLLLRWFKELLRVLLLILAQPWRPASLKIAFGNILHSRLSVPQNNLSAARPSPLFGLETDDARVAHQTSIGCDARSGAV